jgi:hypothetical protein
MHCTNKKDVAAWWQELKNKDITIRRYTNADIDSLGSTNYKIVLQENLDEWLSGGSHTTFWHLKQLMINLKKNNVEIPVVATRLGDHMFVDPGGSRLAVLEHLGTKNIDVDVIYPKEHIDKLQLGDYLNIESYQALLEPYEKIGVNYSMEMCYDVDCITCRNNNVIHNGAFRYSVTWDSPWFYVADYHNWYEQNKDTVVEDIMDWYVV